MRLVKTDYTRFKSLQACPDHSFFSVLTNRSVAFWGTEALKEAFDAKPDDLMQMMRPTVDVPQTQRLLCSAISIIQPDKQVMKTTKKKKDNKAKSNAASKK